MAIETKTTTATKIAELVGRDLTNFKIVEMTEVYLVNDDGRRSRSLLFFNNQDTATAFAQIQTDANHHRHRQALVLTDGIVGYTIQDQIKLSRDEDGILETIKDRALAKLSPAERKILGLE